ncbi:MAG TPA: glycosyltransferase [Solimonas sp.]|nr:glycosyltransferase [Solimonas sp.]
MTVLNRPLRVLLVRTILGSGGADRITITLLKNLPREHYELHIAMLGRHGLWVDDIPADVGQHILAGGRVRYILPSLWRLIRRLRPDVVFSPDSGMNVPAVLATRLSRTGAKVVTSERNILLNGGLRPKMVVMLPIKFLVYRLADQVTALSGGVADDLAGKLRLVRQRIRVLYNPLVGPTLPAMAALPVDDPWLQPGNKTILMVCRFVPWKGHFDMLDAFQKISTTVPESRLIFMGHPGLTSEAVAAEIVTRGMQDRVRILPFDKNPYRYFARCAVSVVASHNEGFCNVIVEAMASGAPVVSTDCPHGPSEIITDGVDGFLVPVADPAVMAERVVRLLTDPALAARFSAAGRESSRRFTIERVLQNYRAAIHVEPVTASAA